MAHAGPRHELKYYITTFDRIAVSTRLGAVMRRDPNGDRRGAYTIRSLYFDDIASSALFDKRSGALSRRKFRIRTYNGRDDVIRLEKKERRGDLILKTAHPLSRPDYERIHAGDVEFLRDTGVSVLQEFYRAHRGSVLRPKVIVEYTRQAFLLDAGETRVTLDSNLRSSPANRDLFEADLPLLCALAEGLAILEVKYTRFLPELVRNLVQLSSRDRSSVSKYVVCRGMGYAREDS